MTELDLRAADVAKLTRVSKSTVSQWLNGIKKPSGGNLLNLSKALDCSADWLVFGKIASERKQSASENPSSRQYPLISWVQAYDWLTMSVHEIDEFGRYACPVPCGVRTFVLRVYGISMQPTFDENELIFVDPDAKIGHGKYVVARQDSIAASFKQLVIEDERKFLKPANPNWPEQLVEVDDSEIIGVVVFSGREF